MKKQIFLSLIAACSLSVAAQDFDTNPTIKIDNKEEDLRKQSERLFLCICF